MNESGNVIEMRRICTTFGQQRVHDQLDLTVRRGEILALVGGSGSGKSTLLREMIMLQRPSSGSIKLLEADLHQLAAPAALALRLRFGVMFQHGGLFGALTILQNIGLPMREHRDWDEAKIETLCAAKLALSGLEPAVGTQYPNQLSGGMLKRAALARALALEPELLFLDEPSAGLDPASATGLDESIRALHASRIKPTIVMITHDLDLMWQVAQRVLVLGQGKVLASGTMQELSAHPHPLVRAYFDSARGRAAQTQAVRQGNQSNPAPALPPEPPPEPISEPLSEPPPEPISEPPSGPTPGPTPESSGAPAWKPK